MAEQNQAECGDVLTEAVRRIDAARHEHWQQHLRDHPHSDGTSCPRDYGVHDALASASNIVRELRREVAAALPAPLTPVIDAHYPTTPVQCACGWRMTDPGSGSWVEHMVAAAQAAIPEPDNHHNAALCPYCTPRAGVALPAEASSASPGAGVEPVSPSDPG